jgi:hypothetical protein
MKNSRISKIELLKLKAKEIKDKQHLKKIKGGGIVDDDLVIR